MGAGKPAPDFNFIMHEDPICRRCAAFTPPIIGILPPAPAPGPGISNFAGGPPAPWVPGPGGDTYFINLVPGAGGTGNTDLDPVLGSVVVTIVPEPSSMVLMGFGMLFLSGAPNFAPHFALFCRMRNHFAQQDVVQAELIYAHDSNPALVPG